MKKLSLPFVFTECEAILSLVLDESRDGCDLFPLVIHEYVAEENMCYLFPLHMILHGLLSKGRASYFEKGSICGQKRAISCNERVVRCTH